MKAEKKVIAKLNKCYAVAQIYGQNQSFLLTAAEKNDPCYLFDLQGNKLDTVWETDGGIMTMEALPGKDGEFLSTRYFFSPNDSARAQIVWVFKENGSWKRKVLLDLPFVHRFGILEREGMRYLVACTLKSAHAFKNDWTCPGRVWVASLLDDLSAYDEEHQLVMEPVVSGLFKNHGFCKMEEDGYTCALVGTENGVYKITPPKAGDSEWGVECLLEKPASDMLYLDFDGDGERELLVLSPFHGSEAAVYKKINGDYTKVYVYPKEMPFLHAIWGGVIQGSVYGIIGNREGDRELTALHYDPEQGYVVEVLDAGAGPANVMHFQRDGKDFLIAANRETDEVALYELHME